MFSHFLSFSLPSAHLILRTILVAENMSKKPDLESRCLVCEEPASGHLYYGGQSCYSCRVFFRRCVLKPSINACRNKDTSSTPCNINVNTRSNCQYCRFRKCMSIGMDPEAVSTYQSSKVAVKDILEDWNPNPPPLIPIHPPQKVARPELSSGSASNFALG